MGFYNKTFGESLGIDPGSPSLIEAHTNSQLRQGARSSKLQSTKKQVKPIQKIQIPQRLSSFL